LSPTATRTDLRRHAPASAYGSATVAGWQAQAAADKARTASSGCAVQESPVLADEIDDISRYRKEDPDVASPFS
jgi:hypothetical protein